MKQAMQAARWESSSRVNTSKARFGVMTQRAIRASTRVIVILVNPVFVFRCSLHMTIARNCKPLLQISYRSILMVPATDQLQIDPT